MTIKTYREAVKEAPGSGKWNAMNAWCSSVKTCVAVMAEMRPKRLK